MNESETGLLKAPEVARRLRIGARTLALWRWRGDGPPYLKLGGRIRYSLADLNAWLETNIRLPLDARGADERRRLSNARERELYKERVKRKRAEAAKDVSSCQQTE